MTGVVIVLIVVLIVLLLLFLLFLFLSSRQEKDLKTINDKGEIKDDKNSLLMEEERAEKKKNLDKNHIEKKNNVYKKEDIFRFMEFDRFIDNMIVQNGGSRFTMAIRCKGINYELMSEVEKLSVEEGFIQFLNTLKYPIQLYVQAQNVDLNANIINYENNTRQLSEDYNKINDEYNEIASAFDADEKELARVKEERDKISNVYEYSRDIISYVQRMSNNKKLLQRKFYILISYSTSEINSVDKFDKNEIIQMCSAELQTRCSNIINALSSCSVSGEMLTSNELADLLYSAYNRDDKSLMSVQDAINSGMLRLYSTSEDAFTKEQQKLEEYISNSAQLEAYKAIQAVKERNEIRTPAQDVLEQDEEISRRATNLINNSKYSKDIKEAASQKILDDYREEKKFMNEISDEQKKEILEEADRNIEKIPELEKKIEEGKPDGVKLLEKSKQYATEEELEDVNVVPVEDKKVENTALPEGNVETPKAEKTENAEENKSENLYSNDDVNGDESII